MADGDGKVCVAKGNEADVVTWVTWLSESSPASRSRLGPIPSLLGVPWGLMSSVASCADKAASRHSGDRGSMGEWGDGSRAPLEGEAFTPVRDVGVDPKPVPNDARGGGGGGDPCKWMGENGLRGITGDADGNED